MGLADHRVFLPVTRELLRAGSSGRPRDLLAHLGIPETSGYRVLQFYAYHGAVATGPGALDVDPRKVLALAGGLRADKAVPERRVKHGPPLAKAAQRLAAAGVPYVASFLTAANRIGYFEPERSVSITIPSAYHGRATKLLGASGRTDAHPYDLHHEAMDRLDVVAGPDGIPTTSPLQTLVDLAAHPRGGAHLAFLEQVLRRRGALRG